MSELTFYTRAGAVVADARGEGPPLLLLPANGHDARDFDAVRPALCRRFRTIALDWPAMGRSPSPERPHELTASVMADALEDVTATLGPSLLIGHSLGGFAAARLAIRHPERVRGLVLVDSGGFVPLDARVRVFCALKGMTAVTRALEARFARFHTKLRNEHTAAMLDRIERARLRPGYAEAVAGVWRSFARAESSLLGELHALRAPTCIVWGARDPVLPARLGRALHARLPGSSLWVMSTGHSPFVEAPETFLDEVLPFLDRTVPAPVAELAP